MSKFGELLRICRNETRDPKNLNKPLTLERFVDSLAEESDQRVIYTYQTLANWEKGKGQPPIDNREVSVAIVKVLNKYGGIVTLKEANRLLSRPMREPWCI